VLYLDKIKTFYGVLDELLARFYFSDDNNKRSTTAAIAVRKVGIKVSNLVRV
jgi:hypothetical protein